MERVQLCATENQSKHAERRSREQSVAVAAASYQQHNWQHSDFSGFLFQQNVAILWTVFQTYLRIAKDRPFPSRLEHSGTSERGFKLPVPISRRAGCVPTVVESDMKMGSGSFIYLWMLVHDDSRITRRALHQHKGQSGPAKDLGLSHSLYPSPLAQEADNILSPVFPAYDIRIPLASLRSSMSVTGPPASRSFFLPLPAELLIRIFELATDNPTRNIDLYVELPPFESALPSKVEQQCDDALRTKLAITTACRAFRDICGELLYEDIRVRYGSKTLADILETKTSDNGLPMGSTVKRAVLFPTGSEDENSPVRITHDTRRILSCCPNLRAIFRPRVNVRRTDDAFLKDKTRVSEIEFHLHHLQRVDWSSSPCDDPPVIAQIPQSVWSSPGLRTLSVGVVEWRRFSGMQETETTEIFTHITTLRVRSLDAFGVPGQRLFTLKLPKLKRIVLDQPDSMYALFSIYQYGSQITTLEFGAHSGFLQHDYIAVLLVYCPNATDLYIPIFSMHPTRKNTEGSVPSSYLVTHLCLTAVSGSIPEDMKWDHLLTHFDTLCGPLSRFTNLKKITFFGSEWRELIEDSRVLPILTTLRVRGISLESNNQIANVRLQSGTDSVAACELKARRGEVS